MSRLGSQPRPTHTADPFDNELVAQNLERLAWLMDRAIKVPGTRLSFGLDAVLGLLPGAGDVLTGLVQTGLVLVALRHYHVPKIVAARMVGNVLLDTTVGTIPFVGDLFDMGFKANTRNVLLLEPYRQKADIAAGRPLTPSPFTLETAHVHRGMPWRWIILIGILLIGMLVLMMVGFIVVVRWLFNF
jgi:Domain of unknown function (DUF4112)